MKAAYPGIEGTFAHEACLRLLPRHEPLPQPSFEAAANAVARGIVEAAILPLRNSIAGEVPAINGLIEDHGLVLADQLSLPIRLHLLGLPGCRLEDIRSVSSHPMALSQCSAKLRELGFILMEAPSTAQAARDLVDRNSAALASERAAIMFGLSIIASDMMDRPDSHTTFAVVRNSRPLG